MSEPILIELVIRDDQADWYCDAIKLGNWTIKRDTPKHRFLYDEADRLAEVLGIYLYERLSEGNSK